MAKSQELLFESKKDSGLKQKQIYMAQNMSKARDQIDLAIIGHNRLIGAEDALE